MDRIERKILTRATEELGTDYITGHITRDDFLTIIEELLNEVDSLRDETNLLRHEVSIWRRGGKLTEYDEYE